MQLNTRLFLVSGVLIVLAIALLVSPFASSDPDGLEAVADRQGFADAASEPAVKGPLADYGVAGIDEERVSTGVSGAVGVLLTFGLGIGLFAALKTWAPDGAAPRASDG